MNFKNNSLINTYFLIGFYLCLCVPLIQAQTIASPDGYAQFQGTTGGGNATPVVVFTASEFRSAVSGSSPAVVIVSGRLNVGTVSIGSNKTIVGANSTSGLYGGVIRLGGSNYIIQNLIIGPNPDNDAMEVTGATKAFIHKCEFFDGGDGNLDIVRGSDYVTVSWCKFYYIDQTNHKLSVLIGNGDDVTTDEGKLHVTMHHNWFAEGCRSRMPRVRYGYVHIFNNYYSCTDNNYCIGTGYKSHIRLESSYFDNIKDPWETDQLNNEAQMGWDNLIFVGCSQPTYISNSYPVFDPPYSFEPDPVEDVKNMIRMGAGNVFGGENNDSLKVSIISPSDSAKFLTNSGITLEADALSENDTVDYVKFYCDSLLSTDVSSPYSYTWDNVNVGKYYLWATATDKKGNVAISKGITTYVGSNIVINRPIDGEKFLMPVNITIEADAWDADGSVSKVEFYQGDNLLGTDYVAPYSFTWNDVQSGTFVITARSTDNHDNVITSNEVTIYIPGGPEGYDFCSEEYDECGSVDKLVNIAFGAEGKFYYRYNVIGVIDCGSAEFGGDPIPDVTKACYVQEAPTPYVGIVYPASGKIYTAPADITFYTKSADNDGTIDSVKFYLDDELIGVSKVGANSVTTFKWSNVPVGEYSISARVKDDDGNTFTSESIQVIVQGGTGIFDQESDMVYLYPNPVTDQLKIKLKESNTSNVTIALFNSFGKKILDEVVLGNEQTLDLYELTAGVYIISMTTEHGKVIRKFVKK